MASASSPVRQLDPPVEADEQLNDPEVLEELGRLADESDAEGGVGDVDGESFCREFLAETLRMAAARGLPTA